MADSGDLRRPNAETSPRSAADGGPRSRSRAVRAAWIIGGSLFTAVTLAFGTAQAVAGLAHEERDVRTVITRPVQVLDIVADGSVTVIGDDVTRVTIDERVSDGLRKPDRSITANGDELVVRGTCSQFLATFCGDDFVVRVPRSVFVLAHADGITAVGVRAGVDLTSEGDGIRVRRVAGPVRLRSHGDDIAATAVAATKVDAVSYGGDISLAFTDPPRHVYASSEGGGILAVLPADRVAYRVDATASGGSVDTPVRTDPTSPHVIRARSQGGDVTIRYRYR
jgi:hypothetical protein